MPEPNTRISYLPTAALSYNPGDPVYWDAEALQTELTRVFEICHGCRMCFKYCDAFPSLFQFLDNNYDGDVTRITWPERRSVLDACFQCKLCEVQCPYTPRDNHQFQVDFPKLVHRYKAQQARKDGVSLRDRFLGNPDIAGMLARAQAEKTISAPIPRCISPMRSSAHCMVWRPSRA